MSDLSAIYVHIPFCVKKCGYCDFFSITDLGQISPYTKALIKEIERVPNSDQEIETVYFGGGTPSVLSPADIGRILSAVHHAFHLSHRAEITIEVNPGTTDYSKLKGYRAAGINRLSIGVQSFDDKKLAFLTRIHRAKEARETFEKAVLTGFHNIGLDLMYGLPFETQAQWQKDLDHAISLGPSHLSCYMLTLEPGTPLYEKVEKDRIKPVSGDLSAEMFKQTSTVLTGFGYDHYEISNFAKGTQNRSKHNAGCWQGKPYLGLGAAAHSFDGIDRFWNHSSVERYILDISSNRMPREGKETLTRQQQMIETVMLQLRTSDGIDMKEFKEKYGIFFQTFFVQQIDTVLGSGLAELGQDRFVLNLEGRIRLNSIVDAFVERILFIEP